MFHVKHLSQKDDSMTLPSEKPSSLRAHWENLPDDAQEIERVRAGFISAYGYEPEGVWSAPGRLNLLGEYIDFLGGTCLPMPLPYRTYIAGSARTDGVLRAASAQMPADTRTAMIRDIVPGQLKGWFTYVAGVAWAMNQEGGRDIALPEHFGADLYINSRVPVGGGLSSSAALEASTALALLDLSCPQRENCAEIDRAAEDRSAANDALRARLAQVCINAENTIAGAQTGGLDQSAALRSLPGQALAIDFRDFSIEPLHVAPEHDGLAWLVIDTNTPHELIDGGFAARRAASESAASALGYSFLRQALPEDLSFSGMSEREAKAIRANTVDSCTNAAMLAVENAYGTPPAFPRGWVRHAFHDMMLVPRAIYVLKTLESTSNPTQRRELYRELGHLLTESFVSMKDELRVSRVEIDETVRLCLEHGALGARIVGGGFGGAVMALIPQDLLESTADAIARLYASRGWAAPRFLPMRTGYAADIAYRRA